jgi:hypothetical protein
VNGAVSDVVLIVYVQGRVKRMVKLKMQLEHCGMDTVRVYTRLEVASPLAERGSAQ